MKSRINKCIKSAVENYTRVLQDDVLQEQMLTDFVPKGTPHATGGLISGYATGGVSNLFRRR